MGGLDRRLNAIIGTSAFCNSWTMELVESKRFDTVRFVHLTVGHTKFAPDNLFASIAKTFYNSDVFCIKMLDHYHPAVCNQPYPSHPGWWSTGKKIPGTEIFNYSRNYWNAWHPCEVRKGLSAKSVFQWWIHSIAQLQVQYQTKGSVLSLGVTDLDMWTQQGSIISLRRTTPWQPRNLVYHIVMLCYSGTCTWKWFVCM